ncbi:MAG: hypothetical protein WC869_16110 [Phycisphaerae bacterium]|jgi:hypothetical protein
MRLRDLVHAHVLYDTIEVQLPCEPGFKFALFRDLMGKTREQTNFDVPIRLHVGEEFRLNSVVVKVSDEALWGAANLTLMADARPVLNRPLAHFKNPFMEYAKFMDNTDIRGHISIVHPVPGTGVATVRVELHGTLVEPVPKDWKPE